MVIDSKPAERPFLDHDQVEDSLGNIYVVVGNLHPPNAVIAYIKYVPTNTPTYWRRGSVYYERVIRNYGVRNVKDVARGMQYMVKDPVLGCDVPLVKLSNIRKFYFPEARLCEIVRKADDELELKVIKVVDFLRTYANLSIHNLGVDGSILAKIHNPRISDIDMIVYGCKESLDVVEGLTNSVKKEELAANLLKRLEGQSRIYGIPKEVLKVMQPPYRYLRVDGTDVNIMFVSRDCERYGSRIYKPVALVEAKVMIEGGECTALYYPSRASISRVMELSCLGGSAVRRDLVRYVISYENVFSYVLYNGGELLVKGVLEEVIPDGYYVIIVGAYENPGYIIPSSITPHPS